MSDPGNQWTNKPLSVRLKQVRTQWINLGERQQGMLDNFILSAEYLEEQLAMKPDQIADARPATGDAALAKICLRAAEGFQDSDDVELGALISAGQCRRIAAFLSAPSEIASKNLKLVPMEATEAMVKAGIDYHYDVEQSEGMAGVYRAMINAAPQGHTDSAEGHTRLQGGHVPAVAAPTVQTGVYETTVQSPAPSIPSATALKCNMGGGCAHSIKCRGQGHCEYPAKHSVDGRDFYELCQQYRHARHDPVAEFDAIRDYIKHGQLPFPSYEEKANG